MTTDNPTCIDVCNSLLRGELSAVESYSQAIEKFSDAPERSTLESIRTEHSASVTALREHLAHSGAEISESSGAWGDLVKALQGTAKLLGETPVLALLEQGEKHGIDEYSYALENEGVEQELKAKIREKLLPALQSHVAVLQQMKQQ